MTQAYGKTATFMPKPIFGDNGLIVAVVAVVQVSPAALADIEEIMDDLTTLAGPIVADKYERDVIALFARIAASPGIGLPRPKLGRDAVRDRRTGVHRR